MANLSRVVDAALAELAAKRQREAFFNDPILWADYMLGVKLWSKQRDVAQSVVENKSTAVKAGHGVGKSFLVAVLSCWWIDTRYPNAFVASTAPSQKQIAAIVWGEIRKMYAEIEKRHKKGEIDHALPGYITADNEWKIDGGLVIGFGRKPPENKEGDSFQGIHGRVLAIGDEACGLSGEMIDALGNITSNESSRRILIANPTNPASHFAKIFKEETGAWTLHTISVLDSPHFTGEIEEMTADARENLTGHQYVEDKKLEYGENSARYKSRVLGEFAFDIENTLFTPEDIEVGNQTDIEPPGDVAPRLGVDVAKSKKRDSNAAYLWEEGKIRFVEEWWEDDATITVAKIDSMARKLGVSEVRIDAAGLGGPMADQLVVVSEGLYRVVYMVGNHASTSRRQWLNARAQWWDNVRLQVSKGQLDLDPADEKLVDELLSVQYLFAPTGGLQIESKESMMKRGVKSPNRADAMIYAAVDLGVDFDDPLSQLSPGDRILMNAADILGDLPGFYGLMGGRL